MFNVSHHIAGLDWIYSQSSGRVYLEDGQDGRTLIASGYSGSGDDINRPASDHKRAVGPIPRGVWRLDPPVAQHSQLGQVVIPLEPQADAEGFLWVHGRSAFRIHGDNRRGDNSASRGCIILNRDTRDLIARLYWLGVRRLIVTE